MDNGKDYRSKDFAGGRRAGKIVVEEKKTRTVCGLLGITPTSVFLYGNGVHVRGICGVGSLDAFFLGVYPELSEQFGCSLATGILDHVFKRFDPFPVFSFFFRYLRTFFHYPYKTRQIGAAGEFATWKNHVVLVIWNPASDTQNGALDLKRKPGFGKSF